VNHHGAHPSVIRVRELVEGPRGLVDAAGSGERFGGEQPALEGKLAYARLRAAAPGVEEAVVVQHPAVGEGRDGGPGVSPGEREVTLGEADVFRDPRLEPGGPGFERR
jgi:hypothetical protein